MRIIKIILGSFIALVLLAICLIGSLILVINRLDWNKHLDFVASTVEKLTDWRVDSLQGLTVHLGSISSLSVTGLGVKEEPVGDGQVFSVKEAAVTLRPLSWFDDRLVFDHISLKDAYLRVKADEEDAQEKGATRESSMMDDWPLIFIRDADVEDFRMERERGAGKKALAFAITSLQLHADAPDSPVQLTSHGSFMAVPYQLTGTFGSLASFQTQAHDFPIQFSLVFAEQRLQASGAFDLPAATVRLDGEAHGSDYSILQTIAKLSVDSTKPPPYHFRFQLVRTPTSVALNDFTLKLGASELAGALAYKVKAQPARIEGTLHSRLLRYRDFAGFLPAPETKAARASDATKKRQPWGDFDRLMPVAFLQGHAARLSIAVDDYRGRRNKTLLRNVQAAVALNQGRLALQPFQLTLGRGSLGGSFIVDSRNRSVHFEVMRQGQSFDFIRAGQAFLPMPRPWPISYLTAKTMKMSIQWPATAAEEALGLSFLVSDGLVRLRAMPVPTKKPRQKEPGIQIKLAAYPPLILKSGVIQDLDWVYAKKGKNLKGHVNTLRLTSPAVNQPLHVSSEGAIMRLPYQMKAQLGSYQNFRDSRRSYPLEIKATLAGQTFNVRGRLRLAQERFDLAARARGKSLRRLQPLLPISVGPLPAYDLSLKIVHERGLYNLSDLAFRLGESHLQGDLALNLEAAKPSLAGDLNVTKLRYQDIVGLWNQNPERPVAEAKRKAQAKGRLFPDKPLPLAVLNKVQGDIRIQLAEYYGPIPAKAPTQADAHLRLREGRLSLVPINVYASLGKVGGTVTLDAGRAPPRILVNLGLESLNLTAAARRMALRFPAIHLSPRELVKGKLMGTLELKSRGSSVAEWVSHADGQLQFAIEQGYLASTVVEALSMDLTETLAALLADHPPAMINCMYAAFQINQGRVQTDEFFLSTKDSNVRGEGYVDLRREYIDYRFDGSAKDFSIGSVASPVSFQGPLDNIRVHTSRRELFIKTAAALALGTLVNPFLAVVPFIEPGLEKSGQCQVYQDLIVLTHRKADEKISAR